MKKIILLVGFILMSTAAQAQWWKRIKGNGNMVTETRNTAAYDKIAVAGFFDVHLVKGEEGEITLKGEENLLEYISTTVKNGVLLIKVKQKVNLSTSWNKSISLRVPVTEINGVKLSGSGDVTSEVTLEAPDFEIAVSGSGDIVLDVDAQFITTKVSGSGDIDLSGKAKDIAIKVSGSGDVNAYGLEAQNAKVEVSGAADVKVHATGLLEARVSGSGDVRYKGNPKKVSSKVSGSGDVSQY